MLHVLEGIAQQANLVIVLNLRQHRVEVSFRHFVCRCHQLFQRLGGTSDAIPANQPNQEYGQQDKEHEQSCHDESHDVDDQIGNDKSHRPSRTLDGREEDVAIKTFNIHFGSHVHINLLSIAALFTRHHPARYRCNGSRVFRCLRHVLDVVEDDAMLFGMHDERAVLRYQEAIGHPARFPRFPLFPPVFIAIATPPTEEHFLVHRVHLHIQRVNGQVSTKHSHRASLLVADGMQVGYQWCLRGVVGLEEGFRPESLLGLQSLHEPLVLLVVMLLHGVVDDLYMCAVAPIDIWHVAAPFLRIVVLHEADAATAHAGVLLQDALQQHLQPGGVVKAFFHLWNEVQRPCTDVGGHAADLLGRNLQHVLVELLLKVD